MKSAIHSLFHELAKLLPGFAEFREADPCLIRGRDRALVRTRGGITEFVVLVRHTNEPTVTLELAWSARGRFPVVGVRPCFHEPTPEDFFPEYVFRVRSERRGRPERWWRVAGDLDAARIEALASELASAAAQALPVVEAASRRS
jgi:hypothetical protein